MLAFLTVAAACTPIPAPPSPIGDESDTTVERLERGAAMPPVELTVEGGRATLAPDLFSEYVVVLAFIALAEGDAGIGEDVIRRLAELEARAGQALSSRLRIVLVPLEATAEGAVAARAEIARQSPDESPRWIVVDDARPRKLALAAHFGVVTWRVDSALQHTIAVAVISHDRVHDIFAGLDPWSVDDLLGSAAAALP